MSYLSAIPPFSGDNMGSLFELQVVRTADISSMPAPVRGTVYGDIVLKAGKSWATWSVTRDNARHRASGMTSMEGEYANTQISFLIPKDQADIRAMLDLAQEDEHVVLLRDANGQWKVFGSLTDPVRFRYSHDSGGAISHRNAYSCEFYSEGPGNSWFYNGAISAPPAGAAPALVKRGDGVVLASLAPGQVFVITSGFSFGFRIE